MSHVMALILLAAVALPAGADVYKWVDTQGNVTYSDTPQPGAEEIDIGPLQTYEAPALPRFEPAPKEPEPPGYGEFRVIMPIDDETLRDNGGNIEIKLALSPQLSGTHKLAIFMDGRDLGGDGRAMSVNLQNVDRGTHTVYATVVDEKGKQVAKTRSVRFYLHRGSLLN